MNSAGRVPARATVTNASALRRPARDTSFVAAVFVCVLTAVGCTSGAPSVIDETKLIDLTYSFDEKSVYWPTATQFRLERVAYGYNEEGRWYASNDFHASEHGGTHLDAPIHFAEGQATTEAIALERFFGPARVIDVSSKCSEDPDYLLAPEDIVEHESRSGSISPGSIVLVRTGFGSRYPDLEEYLGSAVRGKVEGLAFPGIGADAAQLLVERRIDLVGLDTASIDHGPSEDFAAHRVFAEAGIPGLENVANLELLPPTGATIIALPMKIAGGTGGPCRIVAMLP